MKIILTLILFTYIISSPASDSSKIIDSIICVLKSDIIFKSIGKLKEAIKTKDVLHIINTSISIYKDIVEKYKQCSEKEDDTKKIKYEEDETELKLGYPRVVYVLYTIIGENAYTWYDQGGLKLLKDNCYLKYGRTQWYCTFIRNPS